MLQASGVLLGLALITLSVGMVYVARARDGQVPAFMRGDNVQACYAMATMVVLVAGGILIVRSLSGG